MISLRENQAHSHNAVCLPNKRVSTKHDHVICNYRPCSIRIDIRHLIGPIFLPTLVQLRQNYLDPGTRELTYYEESYPFLEVSSFEAYQQDVLQLCQVSLPLLFQQPA